MWGARGRGGRGGLGGSRGPASDGAPYSQLDRGDEREVLPVCRCHGVGALVWTPLAHGLLTGRLRRGAQADIRRAEFGSMYLRDERRLDAVERLAR